MTDTIGFLSAFCFIACGVPQAYKSIKTKSVDDLCAVMWTLALIGEVSGLVYIFAKEIATLPLILNYGLNIPTALIILFLKWRGR